jgi:hypothetical protein
MMERTGTGSAAASSADIDTPLVVQVLHDAQVMLNQALAFERQPEEQKSHPQSERIHHDAVATATTVTSHEQGPLPPLPLAVTPTTLLRSEVEEWARLLMYRKEQPLPSHTATAYTDTNTQNRSQNQQATVELLYQDFIALCNNT